MKQTQPNPDGEAGLHRGRLLVGEPVGRLRRRLGVPGAGRPEWAGCAAQGLFILIKIKIISEKN